MIRETWRTTLLGCGIASSLLYAAMIWGIRYEGYSAISQVPSELTAIGAPTRTLWMWLGPVYTVLVAAFGAGVWRSAGENRAVKIVAGLILAYASLGLLWPFAAMHQRDVLASGGGTFSDTLHVVLGAATVFVMFVAIGFGAAAFGKPFRVYSIASAFVLLGFGALTFMEAPLLATTLPTPWIGLWERINISVFLLWVAVLAKVVWGSDCVPTSSDLSRVMAGDGLLGTWTYSGTLAVDVDAAPEYIWPWLAQIGYQRGGLYSYDWLDRVFGFLDRPSATRILPEFQRLAAGDTIPMGQGPSWPVAAAEPNRALVLDMRGMDGMDWVWQFGLYPVDATRTRLVSRSRVRARALWARLLTRAIQPAGFIMTRRMLVGLKARAEALGAEARAEARPAA